MSTAEQAERARTAFEALGAAFRAMADQARLAVEAVGKLIRIWREALTQAMELRAARMRERQEARIRLTLAAQREWDALTPEQRRARTVASRTAAHAALERILRQH